MSKYTPWFPASIKPVRAGWYQVDGNARRYWNGWAWSLMCNEYDDDATCAMFQHSLSQRNDTTWRGLTAPHPNWKGE